MGVSYSKMSDTAVVIVAFIFFAAVFVMLIMYSRNTDRTILWLLSMPVFAFGAVVLKNSVISSFTAIAISTVMLLIFCSKGDILHIISMIFVIAGGIWGSVVNNLFIIVISAAIVYILLEKFMPYGETPAVPDEKEALREKSSSAQA